ncbi:Phosphopantothenate--cysteine ligase [Hondaea fermentalgiana]|uniref:Phosphopantothenate--cysteine ligase n=1 Tax=Hondaea fermentalgiana TaxID=2315210 RepID=A0A2R5GEW2_9STRA|nr:Phosphopantothenate--cysteine ligase [Hondaea fermentalgiana]|eukprot:GBG29125.1 Phosphopantothenate--cysteine ligase [Hondaea fermentalgiana]
MAETDGSAPRVSAAEVQAQAEILQKYLDATEAPADLDDDRVRVSAFVAKHHNEGRKIAVVTSGGTAVNLEKRAVRFIDNFSTGRRGAATVEHLLERGYAVVMLSRQGSAAPFARTLQDATSTAFDSKFMDCLVVDEATGAVRIECKADTAAASLVQAIREHQSFTKNGMLLHISFKYLSDYMLKLRMCGECAAPAGPSAIFILAAAVSDFHIPPDQMAEHKIQSRSGPLSLDLSQVPKALGVLRFHWAPHSFFVSFKLETDHDILISKAQQSIEKYDMHMVVANELLSRYKRISLVTRAGETIVTKRSEEEEVEIPMVEALCAAHAQFCSDAPKA